MAEEKVIAPEEGSDNPDLKLIVEEEGTQNDKMRKVLAVLAVVLLILLLLGCALLASLLSPRGRQAEDTAGIGWIRSIYAFGPEASQLISPAAAAFQPGSSDLWAADQHNQRLIRWNWFGNFREVYYEDATGEQFRLPGRFAIASNGDRWVVETTYSRVLVSDKNNNAITTITIHRPHAVAVNDDMAVVGTTGGFAVFSRSGEPLGFKGERGQEDDQFDTVNGVALDADNNIYISDTYNGRLSKYTEEGERLWIVSLGRPMNSGATEADLSMAGQQTDEHPAGMQMPMGLCIDGAGRIIVIDYMDFSIAAFDPEDGSFIDKWGTYGSDNGQFNNPSDISYDPETNSFLVADNGNRRLQVITLPGSGGAATAPLARALNGPLAACCIPLLLLVLIAIMWTIYSYLKKRREKALLEQEKEDALEAAKELIGQNDEA